MADAMSTILVKKDEWERFLETVEALVDVHNRLLRRSREFRTRYDQVKGKRKGRRPLSEVCVNCGRDILENAKYCDRCGTRVVI